MFLQNAFHFPSFRNLLQQHIKYCRCPVKKTCISTFGDISFIKLKEGVILYELRQFSYFLSQTNHIQSHWIIWKIHCHKAVFDWTATICQSCCKPKILSNLYVSYSTYLLTCTQYMSYHFHMTYCVYNLTFMSGAWGKSGTTVWESVSTFSSMKPLDSFDKTFSSCVFGDGYNLKGHKCFYLSLSITLFSWVSESMCVWLVAGVSEWLQVAPWSWLATALEPEV